MVFWEIWKIRVVSPSTGLGAPGFTPWVEKEWEGNGIGEWVGVSQDSRQDSGQESQQDHGGSEAGSHRSP